MPGLPPSCPHMDPRHLRDCPVQPVRLHCIRGGSPLGLQWGHQDLRTWPLLSLQTLVSSSAWGKKNCISTQGCVRVTGRGACGRDCNVLFMVLPSMASTRAMECPWEVQAPQLGKLPAGPAGGPGLSSLKTRHLPITRRLWGRLTHREPAQEGRRCPRLDGITGPMGASCWRSSRGLKQPRGAAPTPPAPVSRLLRLTALPRLQRPLKGSRSELAKVQLPKVTSALFALTEDWKQPT